MGLLVSKNAFANFIISSFIPEKVYGKLFPVQIENMVSMVSRSGRHLQRYDQGCRQVVGCIPYRYSKGNELEVLLISSQKGQAMMFPKGGWEIDETMEDAALRETLEEAGVRGTVESGLGKWRSIWKRHRKRGILSFMALRSLRSMTWWTRWKRDALSIWRSATRNQEWLFKGNPWSKCPRPPLKDWIWLFKKLWCCF